MNNIDHKIESVEGETLTVHDMGEGFVILSSANHNVNVERFRIKLERYEPAIDWLHESHLLGAFG